MHLFIIIPYRQFFAFELGVNPKSTTTNTRRDKTIGSLHSGSSSLFRFRFTTYHGPCYRLSRSDTCHHYKYMHPFTKLYHPLIVLITINQRNDSHNINIMSFWIFIIFFINHIILSLSYKFISS